MIRQNRLGTSSSRFCFDELFLSRGVLRQGIHQPQAGLGIVLPREAFRRFAECLERIAAKGVKVEVYKVPADSHESLDAVLKKAKAEIAAQK